MPRYSYPIANYIGRDAPRWRYKLNPFFFFRESRHRCSAPAPSGLSSRAPAPGPPPRRYHPSRDRSRPPNIILRRSDLPQIGRAVWPRDPVVRLCPSIRRIRARVREEKGRSASAAGFQEEGRKRERGMKDDGRGGKEERVAT